MGLRRKQGSNPQESEQFDIRRTVDDFKRDVYAYSFLSHSMWIHVLHVRRKDIPNFVFPGGVRPALSGRSSVETRKLRRSSPQADMAGGRKKRRQDELGTSVSMTESSNTAILCSDATSVEETMANKESEPDFGSHGNIPGLSPEISGFDTSRSQVGPFSNSYPSVSIVRDNPVVEQSSQISGHEGSINLLGGLVGGIELKREILNNGGVVKTEELEFPMEEQAIEAAPGTGAATIFSIQDSRDLEELEVFSITCLSICTSYHFFRLFDSAFCKA